MPTTASIEVGQEAPDLRLKGPAGQYVTLSEYRGKKPVVLVFFPLAFSPVCSHQLPAIQAQMARFEGLSAQVMGISVDSHYANEAFARQLGLSFPLLSDFRHEVSEAYGVFQPNHLYSGRAVFVIDREGRLAYKDVSPTNGEIPSNERLLQALEALG